MGFNDILSKLFGNKSQRDLREVQPYLTKIKETYPSIQALSNDELRARSESLKQKIREYTAAERAAAAADPLNIEAAFNVADLDVVGGHVEDAYARLLRLFKAVPADEKTRVRERLVQLFDVVGTADARTVKARAELTVALF